MSWKTWNSGENSSASQHWHHRRYSMRFLLNFWEFKLISLTSMASLSLLLFIVKCFFVNGRKIDPEKTEFSDEWKQMDRKFNVVCIFLVWPSSLSNLVIRSISHSAVEKKVMMMRTLFENLYVYSTHIWVGKYLDYLSFIKRIIIIPFRSNEHEKYKTFIYSNLIFLENESFLDSSDAFRSSSGLPPQLTQIYHAKIIKVLFTFRYRGSNQKFKLICFN